MHVGLWVPLTLSFMRHGAYPPHSTIAGLMHRIKCTGSLVWKWQYMCTHT